MFTEGNYKVKSVTKTADGEVFEAVQHVRSGLDKYYRVTEMPVPDGVDLEPKDVVRLRIENHSDESGRGKRSWALDRFVGFPYNKERGWDYFDGLGSDES